MSPGPRAIAGTAGALLAIAAFIVVTLKLANDYNPNWGVFDPNGATRVSLAIYLFGETVLIVFTGALIALTAYDLSYHQPISPLKWPVLAFAICTLIVISLGAIGALDLLAHNLRFGWALTNEPEVRVVSNIFLLGSFLSLGAFLAVVLDGRGWSRLDIFVLLCGALLAATIVVLTVIAATG